MSQVILGRFKLGCIGLCAIPLLATLPACNRTASLAPKGLDASTTPSDSAITAAVRRVFGEDPALASQSLDVNTKAGVVIVSGVASTLLAKRRALEIPQTLRGVRAVDDEVHLAVPVRSDAEIKKDVETAIVNDPTSHALAVTVGVKDGVVTLDGIAGSWPERQLVAEDAAAEPSVVRVEDRINVPFDTSRSDDALAADVQGRLANDVWLDGTAITAVASSGIITLTGTVSTIAQRERAYDDSWVLGVRGIQNSGVTVDETSSAARQLRATLPPAARTDAQIVSAVKAALRYDPRMKGANVDVSAQDGAVSLTGVVEGARAQASAVEDARDTVGVVGVYDKLDVHVAAKLDDPRIAAAARTMLASDPSVPDGRSLEVESRDGNLTVSGELDSPVERGQVLSDLASVSGARRVIDATTVGVLPDVLRSRVQDLLEWDPVLDGQSVRVSVDDERVVTLTGTATWSGARAALDDARRVGAQHVENRLKIVDTAAAR